MIEPSHRLLLIYDVDPTHYEEYFRFMRIRFVPVMQELGLHMMFAWQVYGRNYPERQIEFVCDSSSTLQNALGSDKFKTIESRLRRFTMNYSRKVVRFENRFQF